MTKVSLIISYYKNEQNLALIFKGLSFQSEKSFEVIVAEDDFNPNTPSFVAKEQQKYDFQIVLLSQKKDDGFRKNEMLNRSISQSKSDKICFVDGDCIPHRHFIRTYNNKIDKGLICFGKRVNLGENITKSLYESENLALLDYWRLLISDSSKTKEGLYFPISLKFKNTGLLGCNWGILKQHLLDINGFDEDYTSAGVGEDVDIEWRLREMGLKMVSTKNRAIVYHLYHPKGYSDDSVRLNYEKLKQKQNEGNISCLNGIQKL